MQQEQNITQKKPDKNNNQFNNGHKRRIAPLLYCHLQYNAIIFKESGKI